MRQDPPPDLAVEVDISRSSLNKLTLYGSMGVPEFWRHNGRTLKILLRQPDGKYSRSEHSAALPGLAAADVDRFLEQRDQIGETQLIRSFQALVRERFGDGSGSR